jgi:hypothetical protein
VAHAHNPSYWGDRYQEDRGSKPASANSWRESISKNINTHIHTPPQQQQQKTRVGGVAQVVKHLPSKCGALSSNPNTATKKEKKKKKKIIDRYM